VRVGSTWSTTAITWSVLGLRRNIVPGTSATRMPIIRNANGTRSTTEYHSRYFGYEYADSEYADECGWYVATTIDRGQ